ncbi:hypothetical protein N180_03830 [Pedobacter antarcticus 4BY]|uniref:N-acetyltransferase domain-containing protein n=2 Tax=Pedobacter antarcticus TaxID=34086 RepID=A0A081PFM6_9SPHI|nr:GNAT family N-acetyltransferase [Pedobacter antarcticus]KEQ29499.1 hypothetical protein N180_03830 [Pedobacter antarcticus 4BY]SFF11110.1 Acetyltransferase (GNAT) domain-containing protein [Pedobacter antarcticus]
MKIFIETSRLLIRELTHTDYPGIFELDSDPEVHQFLGGNPISSIEDAKKSIELIRTQYIQNGIGRWASPIETFTYEGIPHIWYEKKQ